MEHFIIANLKMHLTLRDAIAFCAKFANKAEAQNLVVAMPMPYLAYMADRFQSIKFCAQDVSRFANYGPYTGQTSASMLKSCNINHVIIGHHECKRIYGETTDVTIQKINNAINASITPIICISDLADLCYYHEIIGNTNHKIIVAYEPVAAIGTNVNPDITELTITFDNLKNMIDKSRIASNVNLVYGGSVNLQNIMQIINVDFIDGVLIGGAALDTEMLLRILECVGCKIS